MLTGMKKEAKRMTFINGIRNLIRAEGYNLGEYEEDAKTMDGNLIYVVRFCNCLFTTPLIRLFTTP